MPTAAIPLPSCIALRSPSNGSYLRYVHEHGETYRQLQLDGKDTINPYTRYDVQVHDGGLVHIRCRYNRKYWVARRRGDAWCIAADADEPEEDLTNPNCTLIKPIIVTTTDDDDGGEPVMTVRFVGAGNDKRRMTFARDDAVVPCMRFVDGDDDGAGDAFTVLNLAKSARLLPRLVMFKGDNDRFLASRRIRRRNVLQFVVTDITDSSARFELFHRNDGTVRIAKNSPGKLTFWFVNLQNGGWIADNMDQSNANLDSSAWFRIGQPQGNGACAIRSIRAGRFCRRLTRQGFPPPPDCLNAADRSITAEALFAVKEPILHREIHSISYLLDDARVYDTTVLTLFTTTVVNRTSAVHTKRLNLGYEEAEMSTWDSTLELKLAHNTTISARFLRLGLAGEVSIAAAEFFGVYNWGDAMEKNERREVVYDAVVPPWTKLTVKAIATRSAVDVPFTYRQRDAYIDGKVEEVTKGDGLYTGINSYNFNLETVEEKLPVT